eukprot:155112_1
MDKATKHMVFMYSLSPYRMDAKYLSTSILPSTFICYKLLVDHLKQTYHELSTVSAYHGCLLGTTHYFNVKKWCDKQLDKEEKADDYLECDEGESPPNASIEETETDIMVVIEETQQIGIGYDSVGHVSYVKVGKFTHVATNAMNSLKPGVVQLSTYIHTHT